MTSDKRLRILHVASWYPSEKSLQNGNFIARHIQAIGELTDSDVLHCYSKRNQQGHTAQKRRAGRITECMVRYPKGIRILSFHRNQKAHRLGYKSLTEKGIKYDLIHLHVMVPALYFAQHFSKKLDIPLIITEHATAFQSYHPESYNRFQRFLLRWFSRKTSYFCPVSQDLKSAMLQKGIHGKYEVIPNVVDTKIFYPAREVEKNSTFEFLHVSSLNDRHKNVSGILEAFAVLLSQGFDAYLTIVGNGFYGKHQNSIDRLSLQSNVSLVKELSIHGIADAMRKSKVLVLFSNYENAPCVISEAHCTGIPVISTNVGGVAEMIDKDNGLLIKPKDQSSLVEAMKWMIKNHIQYDAPAIRQKAVLEYAIDRIAQKYVEVYRRVQSEHGN